MNPGIGAMIIIIGLMLLTAASMVAGATLSKRRGRRLWEVYSPGDFYTARWLFFDQRGAKIIDNENTTVSWLKDEEGTLVIHNLVIHNNRNNNNGTPRKLRITPGKNTWYSTQGAADITLNGDLYVYRINRDRSYRDLRAVLANIDGEPHLLTPGT